MGSKKGSDSKLLVKPFKFCVESAFYSDHLVPTLGFQTIVGLGLLVHVTGSLPGSTGDASSEVPFRSLPSKTSKIVKIFFNSAAVKALCLR